MPLSRTPGITLARVDPGFSMAIVRRLREASFPGPTEGPCGGTGRRARLKIEFRKECWFDSGQGHQLGCSGPFSNVRKRPRTARKPLKNRHFRVHSGSSPFVLLRSQPADLLVFLLVSCWYWENKRSRRLWLFRMKELSRWPARTMARTPIPGRSGPTSTAAPPDRNSTRARGVPPKFPT